LKEVGPHNFELRLAAFVKFLASPSAASVFNAKGLDTPAE